MFVVLLSLLVVWHVYTPIHELLHVLACWITGGTVESLALKPRYGAHLLKHVFPFVVPESDYAGQLTGFSTPHYWAYAFVDFLPYVLSLFGLTFLELARRKRSALFFSVGVVLTFTPVFGVIGDYYEASSLVFTQIGERLDPSWAAGTLISDDTFALLSSLYSEGNLTFLHLVLIAGTLAASVYLILVTLTLQVIIMKLFYPGDLGRANHSA